MGVQQFMAGQLRRPSGLFGRLVTSRLLNRVNVPLNELTLSSLELEGSDRVLEVGFGGGDLMARMLRVVQSGHVAGVDFSADMVALCARRFARPVRGGLLELHHASVEALPFTSGSFAKACTVNTVYFWPDPAAAFREVRRVLDDRGMIVVGFSSRSVMQDHSVTRHGFTLYNPDEIVRLLEDAGFVEVGLVSGRGRPGESMCAIGRCVAG
jgi:ubiquinone/menaquinone biosynthesis C-methylase UbiE